MCSSKLTNFGHTISGECKKDTPLTEEVPVKEPYSMSSYVFPIDKFVLKRTRTKGNITYIVV